MTEPDASDDSQFLERFAKHRDGDAFQELVRRHGALVFNACRRLLGDPQRAEDASQAVFLILVQKAPSLSPRIVLAGWLYQTAIHVARTAKRDDLNRRGREARAADMRNNGNATKPEDDAVRQEFLARVDEALACLPSFQRDAIILRYFEGMSEAEAARTLGCPVGTLSTRVLRGLEGLRKRLDKGGIALSLALLTELLAHQSSAHLPASCATSIYAACLGKGGASSAVTNLMEASMRRLFWMKVKMIAAVIVISMACGISVSGALKSFAAEAAPPENHVPPVQAGGNASKEGTEAHDRATAIYANEAAAISSCQAYTDAQQHYHRSEHTYAMSIKSLMDINRSAAGRTLISKEFADAEGNPGKAAPRAGYCYKTLSRQGSQATGGARDYIVNGKMELGYALIAYPAEYGKTGVNSFIVSAQGTVFQHDLGPGTQKLVESMTDFDPDAAWTPVHTANDSAPHAKQWASFHFEALYEDLDPDREFAQIDYRKEKLTGVDIIVNDGVPDKNGDSNSKEFYREASDFGKIEQRSMKIIASAVQTVKSLMDKTRGKFYADEDYEQPDILQFSYHSLLENNELRCQFGINGSWELGDVVELRFGTGLKLISAAWIKHSNAGAADGQPIVSNIENPETHSDIAQLAAVIRLMEALRPLAQTPASLLQPLQQSK